MENNQELINRLQRKIDILKKKQRGMSQNNNARENATRTVNLMIKQSQLKNKTLDQRINHRGKRIRDNEGVLLKNYRKNESKAIVGKQIQHMDRGFRKLDKEKSGGMFGSNERLIKLANNGSGIEQRRAAKEMKLRKNKRNNKRLLNKKRNSNIKIR